MAGGGGAHAGADAVVLAGGRGTRAGGVDKPGLVIGERTLAASAVSAAVGAGAGRVVVVGPDRPGLLTVRPAPPGGLVFVREEPAGSGPVPALRRGLAEVRAPTMVLLAADLPFLRSRHLRPLLAAVRSGEAGAILLDGSGRAQWLTGWWQTDALRKAAAGYEGRSLHGLLAPLAPAMIHYDLAPGEAPPWLDCDTAADLDRARRWQEEEASG